jgi:hypothetical protein
MTAAVEDTVDMKWSTGRLRFVKSLGSALQRYPFQLPQVGIDRGLHV